MIFDESVPSDDRKRIIQGLDDIKRFGDGFHKSIAEFIYGTDIVIHIGPAENVGGSGSVQLSEQGAAHDAVEKGDLGVKSAAKFVRLNIARETIDTGGQQGIEGTFVHEGKHAKDFALMLSTFSMQPNSLLFNPTAYQRELSAHLTSAFYLARRGGKYAEEGESLGLLFEDESGFHVSIKGIRSRLRRSYGLTPETPGGKLNEAANPKIGERKKILGIF